MGDPPSSLYVLLTIFNAIEDFHVMSQSAMLEEKWRRGTAKWRQRTQMMLPNNGVLHITSRSASFFLQNGCQMTSLQTLYCESMQLGIFGCRAVSESFVHGRGRGVSNESRRDILWLAIGLVLSGELYGDRSGIWSHVWDSWSMRWMVLVVILFGGLINMVENFIKIKIYI